jgi:hypothetical protein
LFPDILGFLGSVLVWFCFMIAGFALGRFTRDAYKGAVWQLQAALALGFFLMVIGVVNYAPTSAAAAFLLGGGLAFLRDFMAKD